MGMMGYRTPNIDRIAREGMIFTDHYGEQSCTAYLVDQITRAIRQKLAAKGMSEAKDNPDVYIVFFVGADQKTQGNNFTDFTHVNRGGTRAFRDGISLNQALRRASVSYYRKGILVIDIVDASTNKLAWRAYCSGKVNPKIRQKKIDKATEKAFKKYPPK